MSNREEKNYIDQLYIYILIAPWGRIKLFELNWINSSNREQEVTDPKSGSQDEESTIASGF